MWIPPLNTQVDADSVRAEHEMILQLELLDNPVDIDADLWDTLFEFCPRDTCFYPHGRLRTRRTRNHISRIDSQER